MVKMKQFYKQITLLIMLIASLTISTVVIAQNHGHDHSGHNHSGHNHGHDHSGHNHSGHNHGHDHSGHNHSGHNHGHDHSGHNHGTSAKKQKPRAANNNRSQGHSAKAKHGKGHGHDDQGHAGHKEDDLDIGGMIMHHITDANNWHVAGNFSIPLPCMVYQPQQGFNFFLSDVFEHGHKAHKGYVLDHDVLNYVKDAADGTAFPKDFSGEVHISHTKKGAYLKHKGKIHELGVGANLLGTGSFYDFSITKVVFTMILATLIMLLLFPAIARAYKKREVPSGKQSFFEPIIEFVRDDIAKPNLGDKTSRYLPYLLTVFFFIWICNLIGLVPFFPGSGNATGNIAVTFTLAVFTFLITTFSGNKNYWGHIFNPPGVPGFVKPIMIIIEFLSIFIKPFALMLRLFANITAGHIIILSFVGLIFIGAKFAGTAGGFGTSIISGFFLLFMNTLELFVAALQAYIFTVLSAVFIGQAIEEHHHEEGHEAH